MNTVGSVFQSWIVLKLLQSKPGNVCKICQKTFTRKADCTRHARLHAGIKPYRCTVEGCGKRFAQYTALKTHDNFKCGFAGCTSTFGDPSSCTRHRKEMHSPRTTVRIILRTSAFKAHLRRHGEQYVEIFKRGDTSARLAGSTGIEEERVQSFSFDQVNTLPSISDDWGSFLSLPEDACRLVSMGMQAGLSPGPSCGSPLVLSPCPRIAPNRDTEYFLSPQRASPHPSSQYSSPMLPTPALTPIYTPALGLEFASDVGASVGVQMNPCLSTQNWTQLCWPDTGTQFAG
ncbi:hypothetical protein H4582DRAFT_1897051 [Lactarius indigo]|nr:hypothetical protein H4582DRAFT_1897051 [Lactarius indigo]